MNKSSLINSCGFGNNKTRLAFKALLSLFVIMFAVIGLSCQNVNPDTIRTFVMDGGTVHFSFEYRAYYKIDSVHPGEDTGVLTQDIAYVDLISPLVTQARDWTYITVTAEKPEHLAPDAKSRAERSEQNASSWMDYELLEKTEIVIDGVKAYRLDYKNRNLQPVNRGFSYPIYEVYREVWFDSHGFRWLIQIRSDSSTAEADKADFEYLLQTFKILD